MEYLYHYTSIEKLALILENRTIRLNSLIHMDDLQEKKSAEISDFGRFTYVSCWTSDEDESIPMWNMYTPLASGVRIKMRRKPFVQYNNVPVSRLKEWASRNAGGSSFTYSENSDTDITYVDANWLIENGVMATHMFGEDILHEVEYTNDIGKLEPIVTNVVDEKTFLCANIMGKHKNEYWKFQKEWRYLLAVYPWKPLRSNKYYSSIQYIDLKLDPLCYADMEITCSPKMTPGNRILLNALISRYNPNAKIKESNLLGRI